VLSSRAVNGHQMYFGDSVVGKASTIGTEISPTPPRIFAEGQNCEIWRRLKHYSKRATGVWKYSKIPEISEIWNKFLL